MDYDFKNHKYKDVLDSHSMVRTMCQVRTGEGGTSEVKEG